MKECSVAGCRNPQHSRGMCQMHYQRWKKHGNPLFEYKRQKYKYNSRIYNSEYFAWKSSQRRCLNPKCPEYKNYGGRGIKVCERWLGANGFDNFMEDMGKRPGDEYSLDRIDVNGNYCPENCRWADKYTQDNNKRTNRYVTINGITKTIMEWSRGTGLTWDCIHDRIEMGWPEDELLSPNNKRFHMITIMGETHSIDYWVNHYNISRSALFHRRKKGWPEERWLEPARKKSPNGTGRKRKSS